MHLISSENTTDKRVPLRRKGEEQLSQPSSLLFLLVSQSSVILMAKITVKKYHKYPTLP
jgi:hypothetical protein